MMSTIMPGKPSQSEQASLVCWFPGFEVRFTEDKDELNQVKKLRIKQKNSYKTGSNNKLNKQQKKSTRNVKKLIDEQQNFIHDGYDSHTRHLIVKDIQDNRVIAYVRVIDSFTAFKIGGFYSETRFNLKRLINNQHYYLEISCLVIDERYPDKHTINLLWSGLTQYVQDHGYDAIIGCISVPLNDHFNKAVRMIAALKANYISDRKQRVTPYQLLPNSFTSRFSGKTLSINHINYLFSKGIRICGDAYWNRDNNCADMFIYYKTNNTPKIPECIHLNEIELGRLCE